MQTAERLEQYERITGREAEDFLARAVKLVQENLPEFTEYFPDSNSEGNSFPSADKNFPTAREIFIRRRKTENGPPAFGPERSGWLMSEQRMRT